MGRRSAQRAVATALTLLTLVVLTACSPSAGEEASGTPGATVSPGGDIDAPAVYIALGDSYTAAPHVALPRVVRGCMRSDGNYPSLLAAQLPETTLVDVSCSGASTGSMVAPQRFAAGGQVPAQLDSVTPDAELITLGIGANDFRYFYSMVYGCLARAEARPSDDAPCRDFNLRAGVDRLTMLASRVRSRVERLIPKIQAKAPKADIVFIGYPKLLPDEGTCPARLPLAAGDYDYVRVSNATLANEVREGVVAAGASYIDLYTASDGHDICSDEPWIAGVRGAPGRAMGLHPYPGEQQAVADLVLAGL